MCPVAGVRLIAVVVIDAIRPLYFWVVTAVTPPSSHRRGDTLGQAIAAGIVILGGGLGVHGFRDKILVSPSLKPAMDDWLMTDAPRNHQRRLLDVIRTALRQDLIVEVRLDEEYGFLLSIDGVPILPKTGRRALPWEALEYPLDMIELHDFSEAKLTEISEQD